MLKRFLTTYKRDGSFDFISNIIEIERYDERDKANLENILNSSPESLNKDPDIDALSLYFHEVTHFLDLTATSWGLEYIYRKYLFSKKLCMNEPTDESMSVFMLNSSEIQMHGDLLVIHQKKPLLQCSLSHCVNYSPKYGSIIEVLFLHDNATIASVPLSMLSVLEANAYASEILCKIRFLEAKSNECIEASLKILEHEVNSYLNDSQYSEYSLLIILCRIHFQYLSLKETLIFFQSLVWRVLNMSTVNLSSISAFLKYTFKNEHYGKAICKDLQRGMSRQVVIFKLILLIHQFVNESSEKDSLILLIKQSPDKIIDRLLAHCEITSYHEFDFGNLSEFHSTISQIAGVSDMFDKDILLQSSEMNHKLLQSKKWNEINLHDLKLLNSVLTDGTIISFSNSISIDVMKYFDDNLQCIGNIETALKNTDISKFHIHPDDVVWV